MIKAAAIASFTAPLEIKQVSIPQPAPNDVLVKLITSDVCHLDLHLAKDGRLKMLTEVCSNAFCFR